MTKGRSRWFRSLRAGILWLTEILVLAVVIRLFAGGQPATVRLADGSRLSLLQVTYGRKHRLALRTAPWWQIWASPTVLNEEASDTDSLALGLKYQLPAGMGKSLVPGSPMLPWNRAEIRNENGDSVWMVSAIPSGLYTNADSVTMLFRCNNFPRRGKRLTVRFFNGQESKPVAQFTIANPVTGSFPVWKPEPIPSVRQDGDVSLALTEVRREEVLVFYGPSPSLSYSIVPKSGFRSVILTRGINWKQMLDIEVPSVRFEIREKGLPTNRWRLSSVTMIDATGNVSSAYSYMYTGMFTNGTFGLPYCSGEKAEKVRAELYRTEEAEFAPSEQQRLGKPLTLPAKDSFVSIPEKWTVESASAEAYLLGGGKAPITSTVTVQTSGPALLLKLTHAPVTVHPLMRVTDIQGRLITRYASSAYSVMGGGSSFNKRTTLSFSFTTPNSPADPQLRWVSASQTHETENEQTKYLIYPVTGVSSGTKLNVALAANPGRTFEFCIPVVPAK